MRSPVLAKANSSSLRRYARLTAGRENRDQTACVRVCAEDVSHNEKRKRREGVRRGSENYQVGIFIDKSWLEKNTQSPASALSAPRDDWLRTTLSKSRQQAQIFFLQPMCV